jgi:hypothetical protein
MSSQTREPTWNSRKCPFWGLEILRLDTIRHFMLIILLGYRRRCEGHGFYDVRAVEAWPFLVASHPLYRFLGLNPAVDFFGVWLG